MDMEYRPMSMERCMRGAGMRIRNVDGGRRQSQMERCIVVGSVMEKNTVTQFVNIMMGGNGTEASIRIRLMDMVSERIKMVGALKAAGKMERLMAGASRLSAHSSISVTSRLDSGMDRANRPIMERQLRATGRWVNLLRKTKAIRVGEVRKRQTIKVKNRPVEEVIKVALVTIRITTRKNERMNIKGEKLLAFLIYFWVESSLGDFCLSVCISYLITSISGSVDICGI